MNINNLKDFKVLGVKSDLTPKALEKWNPQIQAATSKDASISILDIIGEDYWTGDGVTAKRIAGALRAIGSDTDVEVYINSPGGDIFEGIAIYSLLKEHKGHVTVKILGLAASAASVIAMAGDTIEVSQAGFLMIHNSWIVAAGNRHDMKEYAEYLEPFDMAMADLYVERTGEDKDAVVSMMDKETWLGANAAIDSGFADAMLNTEIKEGDSANASAIKKADIALAKAGMPRSERRKLFNDLKSSTQNAVGGDGDIATDTHNAIEFEPLPKLNFTI